MGVPVFLLEIILSKRCFLIIFGHDVLKVLYPYDENITDFKILIFWLPDSLVFNRINNINLNLFFFLNLTVFKCHQSQASFHSPTCTYFSVKHSFIGGPAVAVAQSARASAPEVHGSLVLIPGRERYKSLKRSAIYVIVTGPQRWPF